VQGSGRGSASTGYRRPERVARRGESAASPWTGWWLLLEMPTALLLAAFVGTGWLGYLERTGPGTARPAVVVPAHDPARPDAQDR
jgi:hypothetical protein